MTKSFLIGMATAALVGTSVIGTGIANAVQVNSAPSAPAALEPVGYYWNGYWRPYGGYVPVFGGVCPLRKVWVETHRGPRLQWVRICPRGL